MSVKRGILISLIGVLIAAGCAPAAAPGAQTERGVERGAAQPTASGPKRIVAAINGSARVFSARVDRAGSGSTPGIEEVEDLVNSGLVVMDARGEIKPLLAEAVPSLSNGFWVLLPDGRMETTWRIRQGATWHDGTPFTTDDLVFTAAVSQDREIRALGDGAYDVFESIRAADAQSVTVTWKRPYIEAHLLFTRARGQPLPKHLLEPAYTQNKAGFLELPYWTTSFVGTGPFRLKEWVAGSHTVLEANPSYLLGRPRLDEIEIKFVQDANVLFASLLSGAVELTMGRGLAIEQAAQLKGQWPDGEMRLGALGNWISIYPQYINPNPTAFLNVQFRRAVLMAVDREQMAESLVFGFGARADSIISPKDPEYPSIEKQIVRYPYDLRRATQMVEVLGYSKGPDGIFRDAANQPLIFQSVGTTGAMQERTMFATAEFLQQLGVGTEPDFVPPQARTDRARRAERSGIEVQRQTNGVANLYRFHSRETPLAENNYVGDNRSRYRSPELDGHLDRYFSTVPRSEQMQALGEVIHHMTDQLNVIPLIFDGDPALVNDRVRNVDVPLVGKASISANAHEWDVR
jgi:peptide/nickel transport system substrate-binding protein